MSEVTEAGAIAASEWVGRGEKELADKAASEAIRNVLNDMDFLGEVAVGEGLKDCSYGVFQGEILGSAKIALPEFEIAVDPIEGTRPCATFGYEGLSVIAIGYTGCFLKTDCFYMNKLAVGRKAISQCPYLLDISRPIEETLKLLADCLEKPIFNLTRMRFG